MTNVRVNFPDRESRYAARKLLGADAAVGAEGWTGRIVVLEERSVLKLQDAGIAFGVVDRVKSEERDPVEILSGDRPGLESNLLWEIPEGKFVVDRFGRDQVEQVYEACRSWKVNVARGDWRLAQTMSPAGCFLAWGEADLLGVITTMICPGKTGSVGWIGEYCAHSKERLGKAQASLLDQALAVIEPQANVIETQVEDYLVPTFERRGFEVVGCIHRWRKRRNSERLVPHPAVRGYATGDISHIAELDQMAVGYSRGGVLFDPPNAIADLPLVCQRTGQVTAYGCARGGEVASRLGPVVAKDAMSARLVIKPLMQKLRDRSLLWDVPEQNEEANVMAESLGFHQIEPLRVMRKGSRAEFQIWVYATGGPLVG